ncbi:hypothetical protein ACWEQG_27305 [Microbispora sp. NPDC004025]
MNRHTAALAHAGPHHEIRPTTGPAPARTRHLGTRYASGPA